MLVEYCRVYSLYAGIGVSEYAPPRYVLILQHPYNFSISNFFEVELEIPTRHMLQM